MMAECTVVIDLGRKHHGAGEALPHQWIKFVTLMEWAGDMIGLLPRALGGRK
jgi:hypothetical protein